jgi:hypothetical protein
MDDGCVPRASSPNDRCGTDLPNMHDASKPKSPFPSPQIRSTSQEAAGAPAATSGPPGQQQQQMGGADADADSEVLRHLEEHAPEDLLCPISLELMQDPVLLVLDGLTYDRRYIELHIASCRQRKCIQA